MLNSKDYPEVFSQKSLCSKGFRKNFGIPVLFGITLAGESSAEQVKVRHGAWVDFSCVGIVNLLLSGGMDGAVSGMGVFVDLTVPNALEASRPSESRAEAADAGEHIYVTDQVIDHLLW